MWAQIASLGSSLIGGLITRNDRKKELKRQEALQREAWARDDTAIQRTVKDAQAAGINPAYAITGRAGGGNTISYAPTLGAGSFGDLVAQVGGAVGSAFAGGYDRDPYDVKVAELERKLGDAEAAASGRISGRLSAREVTAPRLQVTHGDVVNNPYRVSLGRVIDTDLPDAAVAEERYGEIAGELFGIRNWLYDQGVEFRTNGSDATRGSDATGRVSIGLGPFGFPNVDQLRRANERARFNNRFNQIQGW